MVLHGRAGLSILGLVAFRLVWGVIGSTHARFLSFVATWPKVRAYLKGQWRGVGHNPLGALSVFALLGLLVAQVTTGLFSSDDISFSGPWFNFIDETLARRGALVPGLEEVGIGQCRLPGYSENNNVLPSN